MHRQTHLYKIFLVLTLIVASGALFMLLRPTQAKRLHASELSLGMNRHQVSVVLGGPPLEPDAVPKNILRIYTSDQVSLLDNSEIWADGSSLVHVFFDLQGRVVDWKIFNH